MIALHKISDIRFEGKDMFLTLDGMQVKLQLSKVSKKLYSASVMEKSIYKISPSGYGIHWSLIDEDLSVNQILALYEV